MRSLNDFLNRLLEGKSEIRVLEAGCGSATQLRFQHPAHITGIDISEKQLRRNGQLQDSILGDIQYYDLGESRFDVIVCWAVLEHLRYPRLALLNFCRAAKDDGLIVLQLPNVFSLKGLLTKYTPLWFHTWYYKHLFGRKNAGRDDVGPFRTYLSYSIAPKRIEEFGLQNGLELVYSEATDLGSMPYWERKSRAARAFIAVYRAVKALGVLVTFGRLGDSDFTIVLRKSGRERRRA